MTNEQKPRRRLASVTEGLRYLGCGRTRLYQLINSGLIVAVKDGARTKIDLDSCDRYHASLPQLPVKAAS